MGLLTELLDMLNEIDKSTRSRVYHADYVKTKDEPYRQHERPRRKKRTSRHKKV
jgi:hypothetical protein